MPLGVPPMVILQAPATRGRPAGSAERECAERCAVVQCVGAAEDARGERRERLRPLTRQHLDDERQSDEQLRSRRGRSAGQTLDEPGRPHLSDPARDLRSPGGRCLQRGKCCRPRQRLGGCHIGPDGDRTGEGDHCPGETAVMDACAAQKRVDLSERDGQPTRVAQLPSE
jgi:hypothetical protein